MPRHSKKLVRVAQDARRVAKFCVFRCATVQIRLLQLDEILRDVGLLRIVVAAHINGVLCPGFIHHSELQGLVGKPVGDVQHLLHTVKEGVPGMADAQQQDLSADRPQTVVAATGGAGGVVFQFPCRYSAAPLPQAAMLCVG